MKREMSKKERTPCSYIAEFFDATFRPEVLQEASLLCGMHPDEATEAIVDAALVRPGRTFPPKSLVRARVRARMCVSMPVCVCVWHVLQYMCVCV